MNVLILSRFGQKRLPKCNVNVKKDGPSQHHVMGSVKVPNGWGWGGGAETGSVVSKTQADRPKVSTPSEDQYIY